MVDLGNPGANATGSSRRESALDSLLRDFRTLGTAGAHPWPSLRRTFPRPGLESYVDIRKAQLTFCAA